MRSQLLTGPKPPTLLPQRASGVEAKTPNPFAHARDFLENRFAYLTISPRARGLSIGVNVNPDRQCNFDCVYCEVDRAQPAHDLGFDPDVASAELERLLRLVHSNNLRLLTPYNTLPDDLLRLRHVALSGDGEPTISPKFLEAVETVVHVRARGGFPFFKIVLITNASGLTNPQVQQGLNFFTPRDEIWAKLDAGSQSQFELLNHPHDLSLEQITANIIATARQRPVIIQSLFCQLGQSVPSLHEIEEFALRLRAMKEAGAQIPLVQIYSATRPMRRPEVKHLPLRTLHDIAETVRRIAGLNAEPF